jgi:hypothetical protein
MFRRRDQPMAKSGHAYIADYVRERGQPRRARWDHDRRALDAPPGAVTLDDVVRDPEDDARIRVTRNVRGDPLGALWARRQIDEHQFIAGRHWQHLLEEAGTAGVRALDTTKERVDGGALSFEGLTDRQLLAARELRRAVADLGVQPALIARLVLEQGLTIAQIAAAMGTPTARGRDRLGWLLRMSLDELAVGFGYAERVG